MSHKTTTDQVYVIVYDGHLAIRQFGGDVYIGEAGRVMANMAVRVSGATDLNLRVTTLEEYVEAVRGDEYKAGQDSMIGEEFDT